MLIMGLTKEEVKSLGNKALFLSDMSSFSIEASPSY
uniref:Uncharacterized protein n=1 Tax=Chenopodium quinoa TaxID=63459 RepID=A0A803M2E0_CHEQI